MRKQIVVEGQEELEMAPCLGAAQIGRTGKMIVLPSGMTYQKAIDLLQKQMIAEDQIVTPNIELACFPLDGVIQLAHVLKEMFGFAPQAGHQTLVQVPVDAEGHTVSAAIGKIEVPTWEGGYIKVNFTGKPLLQLIAEVKRKFESQCQELFQEVKARIRSGSIYKGQAVRVSFAYVDQERAFHPLNDAPQFINTNGITEADLIVCDRVLFELKTKVWLRIERKDDALANKINLRHGVLLSGPFGTGKTLTAKLTAAKAVAHGWSYLYLKEPWHLSQCLELAGLLAPAVIFVEDIDSITADGRNCRVNDILNTLDGVDSKGVEVMTILTSNNADAIEPAMRRAGRIDSPIQFEAPDALSAARFVRHYAKDDEGRSLLEPDIQWEAVGNALAGLIPANIAEAVQSAKCAALCRCTDSNLVGKVSTQDLLLAAASARRHDEWIAVKQPMNAGDKLIKATAYLGQAIRGALL